MKEIVREYCDCRKPNLVPLFIFKFPSKTDKPKKIFFIFPIISSALFCYKISFFRHLSRAGMLQGCPFPPIWSEGHLDIIYKNFLTVRVPGSSLQTAAALIIYYFLGCRPCHPMNVPFQQPLLANRYQRNRTGILTPTAITVVSCIDWGVYITTTAISTPNRIPLSKTQRCEGRAVTKRSSLLADLNSVGVTGT